MQFNDDLLRELLATFAVEAQEHLQTITRDLLALEKGPGPEKSAELLAEIFRAAHSLKGAARAVNLEAAGEVSHKLETLFARLRDGELSPEPALFDLAYQAVDALGVLVQPNPPAEAAPVDVTALCARLEAAGGAPPAPEPRPAAGGSLARRLQKTARPAAEPSGNGHPEPGPATLERPGAPESSPAPEMPPAPPVVPTPPPPEPARARPAPPEAAASVRLS